ncbi:MAG: prephenate dehydrogenase [Elusimicrobia bacterium]|nr:prephenate dehydrogenase [Elusimicrobiota bacterium]
MNYGKVAIFGAGLIGGSIGLDLKKLKIASEITAWGRDQKEIEQVLNAGVADSVTSKISDACKGAEIILLAAPPEAIEHLLGLLPPYLDRGTLIIDVGSVKKSIVQAALKAIGSIPEVEFVGCHPMTGSERRGVENAHSGYFRGAPCILTPADSNSEEMIEKAASFWRTLGMNVIQMSPEEHDLRIGLVSHLPHAVSLALLRSITKTISEPQKIRESAGPSFYDMTRIAASPVSMWSEIYRANAKNLVKSLEDITGELFRFKEALLSGDKKALETYIKEAALLRENI